MLTLLFIIALGQIATVVFAYAIEPKKTFDQDKYFLHRLDLFPEFLTDWEQSFDKKVLVAPRSVPVINGTPSLLSQHYHESKAFHDEWEAAEAYANACACEVGCGDAWEYWEGKGGWDEERSDFE